MKHFTLIAAAACLAAMASSAEAQMLCKQRTDILQQLATGYQEVPAALGLAANGSLVELIRHPEGKTWTIIITQPNGVSCVMATGESWQRIEQPAMNTDPQS